MSEPVLGRSVDPSEYGRLDTFPVEAAVRCRFETAELEALCPAVPGIQPDIYRATIDFVAVTHAIESKSLKLWLVTFRDRRIFAEHLAAEIGRRIEGVEGVRLLEVTLVQNVRGGLAETVTYPAAPPSV
jgi:7-cyano-7-deazaguanine reductase